MYIAEIDTMPLGTSQTPFGSRMMTSQIIW